MRKPYRLYNNAVYKYSAKRGRSLFQYPSFSKIFRNFIKAGELEIMLRNDSTLSQNPEAYKRIADSLLKK